ncbi:ribosome maturation factor RimP [soil metagenome]
MNGDSLHREISGKVEALGFEMVELEQAGHKRRPIFRLRIDRPDSEPGSGVTVEECRVVSRAIEGFLAELPGMAETYELEVSSPGVERPLTRSGDFERFAGQEVALHGKAVLAGKSRRLEGELLGLRAEGPGEMVALRLVSGEEIEVPRDQITRAHLVFRWGSEGRPS